MQRTILQILSFVLLYPVVEVFWWYVVSPILLHSNQTARVSDQMDVAESLGPAELGHGEGVGDKAVAQLPGINVNDEKDIRETGLRRTGKPLTILSAHRSTDLNYYFLLCLRPAQIH